MKRYSVGLVIGMIVAILSYISQVAGMPYILYTVFAIIIIWLGAMLASSYTDKE